MHRIVNVDVLDGFRLGLAFDDGVQGNVDLSHLAGRGVFRIWDDRSVFESVQIGSAGELVWTDQADLCADALYLKVA
jgi:hypothetical protein